MIFANAIEKGKILITGRYQKNQYQQTKSIIENWTNLLLLQIWNFGLQFFDSISVPFIHFAGKDKDECYTKKCICKIGVSEIRGVDRL